MCHTETNPHVTIECVGGTLYFCGQNCHDIYSGLSEYASDQNLSLKKRIDNLLLKINDLEGAIIQKQNKIRHLKAAQRYLEEGYEGARDHQKAYLCFINKSNVSEEEA